MVPFRDALGMALDDRFTESVSKVAIPAAALRRGGMPSTAPGPPFSQEAGGAPPRSHAWVRRFTPRMRAQ